MRKNNASLGLIPWLIEYKPMVIGTLVLLLGGGAGVTMLGSSESPVETTTTSGE